MGLGHFTVGGGTLFQLANTLSNIVGQAVVDRTGLTGNFDIDLTWTPEQTAQRPPDTQDPPRADPDGPSCDRVAMARGSVGIVGPTTAEAKWQIHRKDHGPLL
jgi:uncharacterized protein (TIGR03435 family)